MKVDMWLEFSGAQNYIADIVSFYSEYNPSRVCVFTKQLANIDPRLAVYSTALGFLQIANRVVRRSGDFKETPKALLQTARDYFVLLSCYNRHRFSLRRKVIMPSRNNDGRTSIALADLAEIRRQSAAELLTVFLELELRDFGSVAAISTAAFEALYAYKHGDSQRCLQLSAENVHALADAAITSLTCRHFQSSFSCWTVALSV